ncbi:hypothetical protein [Paraburkholderia sp. 2C]|jgi:hypothetical protein
MKQVFMNRTSIASTRFAAPLAFPQSVAPLASAIIAVPLVPATIAESSVVAQPAVQFNH